MAAVCRHHYIIDECNFFTFIPFSCLKYSLKSNIKYYRTTSAICLTSFRLLWQHHFLKYKILSNYCMENQ